MKPPPHLIGAALLFWGFETGWLVYAVLMAILCELANWVHTRWELSDKDLQRIWDLCALLFFGALIFRYTSDQPLASSAYYFFQLFPLIFLPMALAQIYGSRERMPLSVFSWFMRRQPVNPRRPLATINVGYAYFAACIVSASAANRRDLWFFAGAVALLGWALWACRPRAFAVRSWALALGVWVFIGYAGQAGLHRLHHLVEGRLTAWVSELLRGRFDFHESKTALGTIGDIKHSGRIVMRVQPEHGRFITLLRQASYDNFRSPDWISTRAEFSEVSPETDATSWVLRSGVPGTNALTIYTSLPRRFGSLALPSGSTRIENLPVGHLETNAVAAVRVTEPPGLLAYRVWHQPELSLEVSPNRIDTDVPERERAALDQVAEELGLAGMNTAEKIRAIDGLFTRGFDYSLYVPQNQHRLSDGHTPLSRFLLKSRKGHCEYFATATVLLLRTAGVPARYATGYAVQERHGSGYVVRDRHAHAWTQVWNDGKWADFDTTPTSWLDEEAQRASVLELVADLWSEVRFQFQKWRWLGHRSWLQQAAPWLLGPLILLLVWRILGRKRTPSTPPADSSSRICEGLGADSEFYLIIQRLALLGAERGRDEPLRAWVERLIDSAVCAGENELRRLLGLHYRLRFDPDGLTLDEREDLRRGVDRWLQRVPASPLENSDLRFTFGRSRAN